MRQRLVTVLLLVLTAGVIAFGAISFTSKVRTFSPPGFEYSPQGEVWRVDRVVAEGTGLEAGDLLLLVNGESATGGEQLEERLRGREHSQLLVQRGDRLVEVDYRRPPLQFDIAYLLLALIGVVYLLVGSYTLLRSDSSQVVLFHLWCLASAGVYLFTTTPPFSETEKLIYVLEELARFALPPLTLHFFLIFPKPLFSSPRRHAAVAFLYLPSAFLLAAQADLILNHGQLFAGAPTGGKVVLLDRLWLLLLVAFTLASVGVLAWRLYRGQQQEENRQLLWITIGMSAGFVPFLLLYGIPSLMGMEPTAWLQVAAVLPLALIPLSFAWAILRYRLWDIAIIVRDLITYGLTILIGVFVFSLLSLLIDRGVPEDFALARQLLTVLAGVVVAGLLLPTRDGISSALQRFHYRGHFSRRRALSKFGHDLLHERDLQSLSSSLLSELQTGLDLEQANLYLVEDDSLIPVIPEHIDELLHLTGLGERIWERDYESLTGVALPDSTLDAAQRLFLLGYRYAFPLRVRDRRIGVCVTGYKVEQVPLNSDDLLLVRQLLNQAALAIENAQLLEQLQRQLTEVLELKQFNEEIIESSPAGIAVLDADDHVLSANLAFAAVVGIERNALRRRALSDLLPVDRLPEPDSGLMKFQVEDHHGRRRYLQLSVASFLGGTQHGWRVLVVHDVTERVEMERRLEEKERLAALGAMAAGVAHEVNTPLTGISSYAQMLLAQTPEEDSRFPILKKVERQTFRAARIVNSLLHFARQKHTNPQPVDLAGVIGESRELLEERLRESQVSLALDVPTRASLVEGDENEYLQVLTNILLNAVEAMEPQGGGTIRVSMTEDAGRITLRIADSGPGISQQHLDRIFEPFFTTKASSGGTGLGLSISREIIGRYGGEMTAGNSEAGGCEFVIRFPLSPSVKQTVSAASERAR